MPKWTGKVARNVFGWLLPLLALANLDRSHFFPLADHSDVRFQVIGEGLEILALVFALFLLRASVEEGSGSQPSFVTFRSRILISGFFAIFLLATYWRDFFPNDQFNFSAGSVDFLYAPLGGLGILAISYIAVEKRGKPFKEEEKSAV